MANKSIFTESFSMLILGKFLELKVFHNFFLFFGEK